MSKKYKFSDKQGLYFVTSTIVEWLDVFTRNCYKDILVDSITYCQRNQGLLVHGWVLMPNHLHMIYSCDYQFDPALVLKNIKSFTALKIIDSIINNKQESRKQNMLEVFERNGAKNKSNHKYQFWQHENHPILLDKANIYEQRLNYLHENPVRAGFVFAPEGWVYSSAVDYYTRNEKGLIEIVVLE